MNNAKKNAWWNYTWNPIVGCSPASVGCDNCYAAAISGRFSLPWGSAYFMPDRLQQPEKTRTPGRVFVCSMSDLGHKTVKTEWREAIYEAMQRAPWHQYIVLTKRPGPWIGALPEGCWLGVTCETQSLAHHRWGYVLLFAQPVAFVSAEPMLEPITFNAWPADLRPPWVIAGRETGPKARPCPDEWIDALAAESPCFYDKRKNWRRREFPDQCRAQTQ
jgi:protein gp37